MTPTEKAREIASLFYLGSATSDIAELIAAALAEAVREKEEENQRLRDHIQAAISEINEGDHGSERRALKWLADGLTARAALKGET